MRWIWGLGLAMAGESVWAETVPSGPAEGYQAVALAERLSMGGVIADASPEVQLAMAILAAASLAALAIWAGSLGKVGAGDTKAIAAAIGRLRIIRSGSAMFGGVAGSYVLMMGFIGLANVRPVPTASVLAPGWAEAAFVVTLGLLGSTVAVICERHVEARIRHAAA